MGSRLGAFELQAVFILGRWHRADISCLFTPLKQAGYTSTGCMVIKSAADSITAAILEATMIRRGLSECTGMHGLCCTWGCPKV